ncbi:MAG TPA: S8 family serine peptidase [Thermoanaerobaculia bacterium]|nr:S8 family serine peptidase [Thermoanaerobaculia bacterium]
MPLFRRGRLLVALAAFLSILPLACAREPAEEERTSAPEETAPGALDERAEGEDPFDQINVARVEKGKITQLNVERLPPEARSTVQFEKKGREDAADEKPRPKVHPLVERWTASRRGEERERFVVVFRDDVKVPRFPEPAAGELRDSGANEQRLARAEELIKGLRERRARYFQGEAEKLRGQGIEVRESFWLVNGAVVEMPLSAVAALAKRPDVLYIQPEQSGEEPPQNGNNADDVDDGRARMVSDPYFGLGQTGGWIGLLDTGMRFTHTQFNSPSTIAFRRDCVNGGADCNTGTTLNPNDDCWDHGTSSAAIVTGNANQGAAFRGVTAIALDSFKVYPTSFDGNNLCNGGLNVTASVNGFQTAVAVLDRVIVAEMQGSGSDTSAISVAADAAFDAGAVVIAANGNNGPNANTVNEPAIAHKVIGVGNFDVQTQAQVNGQSRGPAPDNRFKPDIQAPTNTETASNGCGWQQNCTAGGSDTAFRVFGGTSGATPYAAGAAALLRNWLRGSNFSIDPGQVYAQLILSGQQPYPFNNTSGAGPLQLPNNGWAWWGKVAISNGQTIEIPISISGTNPNTFDGALWWPETAAQSHNDVDLSLVDPGGVQRASSLSIPSVFERVRVAGTVASGTWKLRIRGYSVPAGPQTVYWAAHVRQ